MNQAKITLYSKSENTLTDPQTNLIENLLQEAATIKTYFYENFNTKNNETFLIPLINREGIYSGYIENSQTNIDDIGVGHEKINNLDTWESRNIINLYKDVFYQIDNDLFFFSKQTLIILHKKLFIKNYKGEYNLTCDPQAIIDRVKPGRIIDKGEKNNWIGGTTGNYKEKLAHANLIPISPDQKVAYIDDLFNTIAQKINTKSWTIKDIIAFHPHFEAIHPFADGNGRIGRLLLVAALVIKGLPKWLVLNISMILNEDKQQYFENLKLYAINENCFAWNGFFINVLIRAKHKMKSQVNKFLKIYKYYEEKYKSKKAHFKIFNYFLKYYRVHKKTLINDLKNEKIQPSTIYRAFKEVTKDIGTHEESGYFVFTKGVRIWE